MPPEFPAFTPQKIIKILEKSGFQLDRQKGSHCIYLHPESRKRAVVPLHKKDLSKGTAWGILRQAGIEKSDLLELL